MDTIIEQKEIICFSCKTACKSYYLIENIIPQILQQELWMGFIREDKTYAKYYDEFVVLLGIGMCVSEFCGLTESDLDFDSRKSVWIISLSENVAGSIMLRKQRSSADAALFL